MKNLEFLAPVVLPSNVFFFYFVHVRKRYIDPTRGRSVVRWFISGEADKNVSFKSSLSCPPFGETAEMYSRLFSWSQIFLTWQNLVTSMRTDVPDE